MISHLADPSNPAVAICGATVRRVTVHGPKTVCTRCWPTPAKASWPVRLARPYCPSCGQPEGHWNNCPKGDS